MSLMEVNEASCVIQEAAHEDANIIFGAVVDPNLDGKIKITVIATGFDKSTRAALPTPTDLTPYKEHLAATAVARAAVEQEAPALQQAATQQMASSQVAATQTSFAASLAVNRRPPIELSPLAAGANGGSGDHTFELESPYDMPAFLRRQN